MKTLKSLIKINKFDAKVISMGVRFLFELQAKYFLLKLTLKNIVWRIFYWNWIGFSLQYRFNLCNIFWKVHRYSWRAKNGYFWYFYLLIIYSETTLHVKVARNKNNLAISSLILNCSSNFFCIYRYYTIKFFQYSGEHWLLQNSNSPSYNKAEKNNASSHY